MLNGSLHFSKLVPSSPSILQTGSVDQSTEAIKLKKRMSTLTETPQVSNFKTTHNKENKANHVDAKCDSRGHDFAQKDVLTFEEEVSQDFLTLERMSVPVQASPLLVEGNLAERFKHEQSSTPVLSIRDSSSSPQLIQRF